MKERKKVSKKNSKLFLTSEKIIENKDLIVNNTQFQKELIFFKNEILKDISIITKELSEKYEKFDLTLNSETSKLNSLISNSETKINNLTSLIPLINHNQSLLENLTKFQKKTENYIITNDIRYSNFMREFSDNISRHDNILKDSIIYPGIIGPSAKFKTFHDLIDYFLKTLTELLNYKEKNTADLIEYKDKLDNKINDIKKKLDDFIDNISHKNKKEFNKIETKINELSLKIDEVTNNYKLENEKNLNDIIQKNKDFMANIEENIKNKNEENKNILNKLKKLTHKEQKEVNDINKKYSSFKRPNIKQGYSTKNLEKKITKGSSNSKHNSTNSINKSQISNEIKNIESNLKNFIMEEIKKFSNIKKINLSENSSFNDSIKRTKTFQKRSLSGLPKFLFKEKEKEKIKENFISNKNNKRQSFAQNRLSKNIFEKFLNSKEDKDKNNNNNFGKIKEVFIEESFEGLNTHKLEKEKEKEKNSSNMSLSEENIKSYNSSTEKIKKEKEKEKTSNQRKSFDIKKSPIKRASLFSLSGSLSFSSTKEKIKNNFNKEINKIPDIKKELKENSTQNDIQLNINKNKNKIINSPRNNPRLSRVSLTLEGTQKLNLDKINIKNKKNLFNSPNMFKKHSLKNDTVYESLHPIYRNKKFSSVISPYISLMTNNLQEMIRHYDRKSILQRKRNLPWNRSENFLLNKETNTNPLNKENQIINQKYNYKGYKTDKNLKLNDENENDVIEFNKYRNLIMDDI